MKLVGGDSGRCETESFVDEVLLAPSERAVVDDLFDTPGPVRLEHRTRGAPPRRRGPHQRGPPHIGTCTITSTMFAHVADGVDAVRRAAREELKGGADQIKIMGGGGVATPTDPIDMVQYTEEEIRAAVAEAASRRTYAFAHAYVPEAIIRAVRAGVRSIEHGNLIDASAATLSRAGELGVIAPGAMADLLLVDGNPLSDITLLDGQGEHLALIVRGGHTIVNRLPSH